MTIIIGAGPEPDAPNPLPTAEVDLPHPASVPGNRRLLDDDRLKALLNHVHPLVRGFAVEQISRHAEPHLLEALLGRFDDSDDSVALEAVAVIDHERYQAAAEPLLAAFAEAKGSRAVAFAGALATIAPGRLLEAVQAKGRLDDEAYRGVASALALTEAEPVRRFLDKALNRSGALNGERRGALYTAVLLSGDVALTNRVLSQAIDDSKREQPKDASFPSRAALSTLAGLPLSASRNEAGEELLKHTATLLERDVRPALDDKEAAALDDATRAGKPDEILNALQPVVGLTEHLADPDTGDKDDRSADRRSLVRRRRGLLEALVSRAKHIGSLEPTSGALFAAVASRAALTTLAGQLEEAKSEGLLALAKALEIDDPVALAARPEEKWASLFEGRSKRDMRRVVTVVVRESFRRAETLERLAKALTTSGHGRALLDAVAEVKEDTGIHELVIHAVASKPAEAEALVVDILGETPLPDDVVPLALMLGSMIRTERVAVAVGRRFYDIRQLARSLTAQTALRVADPRLLPLLESRAFDREPEELAWALLSLVHDVPQTGRLAEVIERIDAEARAHEQALDQELEPDHEPKLEVLMECEVCGETLRYRFDRAYVDAEAKDEMGDPAFVGPMVCKACGTEDRLKPTAETANVLTQHMLAFLQAAQAGQPPAQPPLVSPARTVVNGKEMGLAAALRTLDEDVRTNPDSIRTRLHRARTRLILKRPGVAEDLDAVRALDADAVEADALLATLAMRDRDHDRAAELAIRALKRVNREPEPRIYDAENVDELRESLEGYLLELSELGAPVPEDDIDLSRARQLRERQRRQQIELEEQAMRNAQEAQRSGPESQRRPKRPRGRNR